MRAPCQGRPRVSYRYIERIEWNVHAPRDGDARTRRVVARASETDVFRRRTNDAATGMAADVVLVLTLALLVRSQIILVHNLARHLTAIEGAIAHRASRLSMERVNPA